ncbi:MAG: hypothetical protein MZV63_62770 [Marinilabiliales bacterium]|nr:hypothetical protein [Marinilabiliales bacterium]
MHRSSSIWYSKYGSSTYVSFDGTGWAELTFGSCVDVLHTLTEVASAQIAITAHLVCMNALRG